MGNNPPWLDSLSDDWVSLPGTPTSPAFTASPINNHSRRSSLQNTPSRIPIPARHSVDPSPSSEKKKVTRPCHFIRREPPTPKTPRTPKTPAKPRSPAPDTLKKSPKPNLPSGRKQPPTMDGRSPLRSVSNVSGQSEQQSTVQIRPKKDKGKEGTPEWRKRLVQGEIPSGEQRDLFAPIGLESVFKPPTPGSPASQPRPIPRVKQPDNAWDFNNNKASAGKRRSSQRQQPSKGKRGGDGNKPERGQGTNRSQKELGVKKRSDKVLPDTNENLKDTLDTTQMRTASGLEDLRNEDITPITFSRMNTVEGNGASEIIKSALKQVTNKLERLHLAPTDRPSSRASDSVLFAQTSEVVVDPVTEDDLFDVTSHSLPQDLSMGTVDYRGRGAFANLHRDPYLDERSFHNRHLSPPTFPSQRLSPFIRNISRIRSSPPFYQKSTSRTDPPTLPRPSSAHLADSAINQAGEEHRSEAMASSLSPLKLFGNHDTFTNNKLLRRMSQFEETLEDESEHDEPVSPSEEARRKGESRSFLNPRHDRPRSRHTPSPHINRFGEGQLDNFDFSDASPYDSKFLNVDSPEPNISPPPAHGLSTGGKHVWNRSYRRTSHESEASDAVLSERNAARNHGLAKRQESGLKPSHAANSPVKDPFPKRRRTIMPSQDDVLDDQALGDSAATDELSLLQRSLMQHGLKYDEDHLLSHSAPRPRTPTPHQTRSSEKNQLSPTRKNTQPGGIGHEDQGSPLSQSVPNVVGIVRKDEARKGSITTQDFLNEATKIMDIIRSKGKGKPNGGLSSVEESGTEEDGDHDSYDDESTLEEFSRPPSREGVVDLRKLREPKEPNPRIISHLKKFQEQDDVEFGVNDSVMSLNLGDSNQPQTLEVGDSMRGSSGNALTRGQSLEQRKRKLTVPAAGEDDTLFDLLRFNTGLSAKSFSARSIPTGSSHSSHAKGVLSSDIVSHLIPEQVNGLTYDRLKHQWVKEEERPSLHHQRTEAGEDDPFKGIPDLSVDELQEMMRTQNSSSPEKMRDSSRLEVNGTQSPLSTKSANARSDANSHTIPGVPSVNLSSVQSKVSRSTSSFPHSGTRETSWGTDLEKNTVSSTDVEHEIKLHEGRISKPPQSNPNHQARVVTISFSSPLVSQIEYSDDESPSKLRRAAANSQTEAQGTDQDLSARTQPFRRRSISRIDESGEDLADAQAVVRRSSDGVQATPTQGRSEDSLVHLRSNHLDTSYSFYLSPLPDFTVNQIDQPIHLEVSYVAQRTHPTSLRQVHGTFALATEDLVKHITEVEPFEPYWEHLRRLVLRRKGLLTLHRLGEFCPRLEELDVSDNDIGQLSGAPSTLRTLNIQNNCLSSLTAWGHLVNLQYLDISGNGLENLDGVSGLIHLRELKANDNNIQNIEGVFDLNGLLSLQLRKNALSSVDFGGAELTRLEELDLGHNQLISVRNIDNLPALAKLDLSFNLLDKLEYSSPLTLLRSLRLSENRLHDLDVGELPALNLLYVDQNLLTTISGLSQCRGLEVLSAREQEIANDRNGGFFDLDLGIVRDVRKVFLSSNKLSLQCLSPSSPLRSLQLLDLASCRLQGLPTEFASKFPNVKVLNLNFNSLPGVNELVGLNCLSRLTVAGNSITRLRKLCQVLSRIGRTRKGKACSLQKVDIRGNPLTVRFYPPAVTGSGRAPIPKLKANEEKPLGQERINSDMLALADAERRGELLRAREDNENNNLEKDPEIDDPYTLPPADALVDQKYLAHLDEATRLRRRVFELMLYAGTGGSLKFLDGLEFRPVLEPGSDMDHAWSKLEQLGVLKKKAITG
ncbi:hypothetical protein ARAM_002338 [Aspergillus rambellii]|uniref:Uncharacterized protein n=2 Tax=Aspergillus subgen. Nidulantes TaxID=2720870 RepID=A0A0F8TYH6_9EURO|nr:hypothetical protein ARAM_002338 [Aspergillus rambellii]